MQLKKFKGIESVSARKRNYAGPKSHPSDIKYRIINDQVIIDIKPLLEGILDTNKISRYKTEKMEVRIPFDTNKVMAGNSITLGIDNKRFIIRLPSSEVVVNKQQKIDYDNTHPHRWKLPQWAKFIQNLHYKYYGFQSLELSWNEEDGVGRGKLFGRINVIKSKILNCKAAHFTEDDVLEYLDWAYSTKCQKASITVSLLTADGFIQEWLITKLKGKTQNNGNKKVRKWDA